MVFFVIGSLTINQRQKYMRTPHWENDETAYPSDSAYQVEGYRGIAWRVFGWETEADEDTEWTGIENRTGKLVCVMIGDDRRFTFDPDEVKQIAREEYCGVCGQIGCCHDGLDRA